MDLERIVASVSTYLDTEFTGSIHWPGTEAADDNIWIEPWILGKLVRARTEDWLYQVTITVNVFAKVSGDTFGILNAAEEIMTILKAAEIPIKDYDNPAPVHKGCLSLKEPEMVDMGERQERSKNTAGRTGLRQINIRCDGIIFPLAD